MMKKLGRKTKQGFTQRIFFRVNPLIISAETIEFLERLNKEPDSLQRSIILDQVLRKGLERKEVKQSNNLKDKLKGMMKKR